MIRVEGGAWLGFLVGGVFIAAGLALVILTIIRNGKCTEAATAHVVRIQEEWERGGSDSAGSVVYYPIFQFTARNGAIVEARATVGRGWNRYRIGQEVALRYNPDKPEQIAVKKDIILAIAGGALFAVIGAGVLVLMKVRGFW